MRFYIYNSKTDAVLKRNTSVTRGLGTGRLTTGVIQKSVSFGMDEFKFSFLVFVENKT